MWKLVIVVFVLSLSFGMALAQDPGPAASTQSAGLSTEGNPGPAVADVPAVAGGEMKGKGTLEAPLVHRSITAPAATSGGHISKAQAFGEWQKLDHETKVAEASGDKPRARRLRDKANAVALSMCSGPASVYARDDVRQVLAKGTAGGMVGQTKGATPSSNEWRKHLSRQDMAVIIGRLENRDDALRQIAIQRHNDSEDAHPFVQGMIKGEYQERQKADRRLLYGLIAAILIGLVGWFLPWPRWAKASSAPTEDKPELAPGSSDDEEPGIDLASEPSTDELPPATPEGATVALLPVVPEEPAVEEPSAGDGTPPAGKLDKKPKPVRRQDKSKTASTPKSVDKK